ncbi:hypothetical protein [Legionella sp. CNM-4043-24]|uniref:hypothetical protein n=1 Tax=Legionella sp. CNM-4043-24 TaxID=3421646 RepID=UPI00403AD69A
MYKRLGCYVTSILFFTLMTPAQALSPDEAHLLQKDYQLYQMWSISRDYLFGMTHKADRVRALAWQLAYVDHLPAAYPQKNAQLALYQRGLSPAQLAEAAALARQIAIEHGLNKPVSEEEMSRVYPLRDELNPWSSFKPDIPPEDIYHRFQTWVQWVAGHQDEDTAFTLDQRALSLLKSKQLPVLYGQVIVKGPESPDMVSSEFQLLPGGYFVGHSDKTSMRFVLAGYKPVVVAVNQGQQVQALPPIIMEPLPRNRKTGVVGRVLPWSDLAHSNILLQAEQADRQSNGNPWLNPFLPLTVTNVGEFYTTGLPAGRYELLISTQGLSTRVRFGVKDGEVRGLSLINLNRH